VRQAGRLQTSKDLLKGQALEERIFAPLRGSLVDGHSWVAFDLRFDQEGRADVEAKYIEFYSLADAGQMPGVRVPVLRCRTSKGCGWMKPCIRSRFCGRPLREVIPKQTARRFG